MLKMDWLSTSLFVSKSIDKLYLVRVIYIDHLNAFRQNVHDSPAYQTPTPNSKSSSNANHHPPTEQLLFHVTHLSTFQSSLWDFKPDKTHPPPHKLFLKTNTHKKQGLSVETE